MAFDHFIVSPDDSNYLYLILMGPFFFRKREILIETFESNCYF